MNQGLKKIFCIGGACVDRTLKSVERLENGTSNPVSSFTSFGGVARNVAENLGRWSKEIHLRCLVGEDREGRALLAHMKALGVDIESSILAKEQSTSHYYAVLNHENDLHIAFADMAIYNHIAHPAFTQCNWPKESLVFIDTNLPSPIVQHFIKASSQMGFNLCVDPVSVSKAHKLKNNLENIFLLKPNRDEASVLTNIKINSLRDSLQAGEILLEKGVKNAVISLGSEGYVIVNEKDKTYFPCIQAKKISNVNGAGDAFIAGILYGLQREYSIIQACQLGAAAAALTLESSDAVADHINPEQLHAALL